MLRCHLTWWKERVREGVGDVYAGTRVAFEKRESMTLPVVMWIVDGGY